MTPRLSTALLILSTTVFSPVLAAATVQTITATHTYVMGDNDSKNDARRICFLEAKRKVLEKAGTYIESSSEVKNFQLSKDQITSYTAAVLSVETMKEDFATGNGQTTVTMTVKAKVDTADMQKRLAAIVADKGMQEKIATQQKQLKQLEEQMKALNTKLGTAPANSSRSTTATSSPTEPNQLPSLDTWIKTAREDNPGVSDQALTEYWVETYGLRQERNQVLVNIQDLENKKLAAVQRITAKTGLIRKYIVRNMTAEEVIGLLGSPQMLSGSKGTRDRSFFYGENWICFAHGLVSGVGDNTSCSPNKLTK